MIPSQEAGISAETRTAWSLNYVYWCRTRVRGYEHYVKVPVSAITGHPATLAQDSVLQNPTYLPRLEFCRDNTSHV